MMIVARFFYLSLVVKRSSDVIIDQELGFKVLHLPGILQRLLEEDYGLFVKFQLCGH